MIWLVIPQICFFAIMAYEAATRPLPPNLFTNILFGFGLVTVITIIPWAIVSAIGFALGFLFRRVLHGRPALA